MLGSSLQTSIDGSAGAVSALGAISNTGANGILISSTGNTATGNVSDSGTGGISITGGNGVAAGTVTNGTITALGTLNNTGGGVISLSMAQPTATPGAAGSIEAAAGVTTDNASVSTNVTYSLRGGVMNSLFSGVNNVNYRSPLTPSTISVQLLQSYVTTYGVAFTDADPQAWIKSSANTAVTVSGGGAFGASPTVDSVLGSLSLSSINGVATIAANRVGGPTTLVTGDILSAFGVVTITAPAAGKGTYTVNPATLTITSKSSSSVYNGVTTFNTLTQAGYTVAGLISTIGGTPTGDAVTSTTSAINVGTSSGTAVTGSSVATAGTYSVIESLAQGSNLSNYSINYVRSTFNVTPATLTITAANDSKTYGSTTTNAGIAYNASGVKTTSTDGFTVSGLLGSDAVSTVTLSSLTGAIATADASSTPYAITPSDAAFASVALVAKKLGILTQISSELLEDSIIQLADLLATEFAYSLAVAEDAAGFLGDGGGTYGGITGLESALAAGSLVTTASNVDTFAELTLGTVDAAVGKLARYPGIRPEWYMHSSAWSNAFERLAFAAGGSTAQNVGEGMGMMFKGYPVNFVQSLPSGIDSTDLSGEIFAYFGDLSMAAAMGDCRGITIASDASKYFAEDALAVRCTERFDINVHDVGDSSNAGAMVGLKFNAS
jgi:hypothetical protein